MLIYLDGKIVDEKDATISVFDHGVLYGDGVFEGIRAYGGRVFKLKEHIDRFFEAMHAIALEIDMSKAEVADIVINTCKVNKLEDAYIRLVVTRGKGDLGLAPNNCKKPSIFCIASKIKLYDTEMYEKGLALMTSSRRRNSPSMIDPQIKSLNYLNNILAKIEASDFGYQEALMLDGNGCVCECTGDNIFILKNGELITPPTYLGILDGITRRSVIDIAKRMNITVKEMSFTLFNVYNADECFLTGTAAEIIPVTELDKRKIADGKVGKVTLKLLDEFKKYVHCAENGELIK